MLRRLAKAFASSAVRATTIPRRREMLWQSLARPVIVEMLGDNLDKAIHAALTFPARIAFVHRQPAIGARHDHGLGAPTGDLVHLDLERLVSQRRGLAPARRRPRPRPRRGAS